jgi:hypothetical protein
MSFARVRLIVAAALFLAWLGWLGWAVSQKGTVQIVSRAQLTAATSWAIADVSVGADGVPSVTVTVKDVIHGEAIRGVVEVRNLPSAATPLPVAGESRTPPAGEYLLPLVKVSEGVYRIAGLPKSPGVDAKSPERPVIYPWTDDVKKQVAALR